MLQVNHCKLCKTPFETVYYDDDYCSRWCEIADRVSAVDDQAERDPKPISAEQLTLLRQYAERHGESWKVALSIDWVHAALSGPLHALRNTHGPTWLMSYELPQD